MTRHSTITDQIEELQKHLQAEREFSHELEATCLQLRNEVLHLQGEAKRARKVVNMCHELAREILRQSITKARGI